MRSKRWLVRQRGFDSRWEEKLNLGVLKNAHYHADKIEYTILRTYNPDWTIKKNGKVIYIEAKGRFADRMEAAKYKWVRGSLKQGEELVFLFMNPNLVMPSSRPRKDGTRQTHSDWADTNGFRWFTEETIKKIL